MWIGRNSIDLSDVEDKAEAERLFNEWEERRRKEIFDVDIPEFTEAELEDIDFTIQLAIKVKKKIIIIYVLNRQKHHLITKVQSFDINKQDLVVINDEGKPEKITLDAVIAASFQYTSCGHYW
jgi:hypothetical protein